MTDYVRATEADGAELRQMLSYAYHGVLTIEALEATGSIHRLSLSRRPGAVASRGG